VLRRQEAEGRKHKAGSRRQEAEGRKHRSDGRRSNFINL